MNNKQFLKKIRSLDYDVYQEILNFTAAKLSINQFSSKLNTFLLRYSLTITVTTIVLSSGNEYYVTIQDASTRKKLYQEDY